MREASSYDAAGNRVFHQQGTSARQSVFNRLNQLVSEESGGRLRFSGETDEPSVVTVQGKAARMLDETTFTAEAEVTTGTNNIPIIATDGSGNSRTNTYEIVVNQTASRSFIYDANGNLVNDGQRTYTWDAKNRLIAVTKGADAYEWSYDGMDRRVSEKKNGQLVRRWVWTDGPQPIEEREGDGTTVTRQFFPQGERHGVNNFYYTRDHLGSIREVLDGAGAVVVSYRYDAWGRRELVSGMDVARFGFTGHLEHPSLGLIFTLYRAYDPETGRWLSRDPFGSMQSQMNAETLSTAAASYYAQGVFMPEVLPGGPGLYAYVGNNPVNLTDPEGEIAPFVLIGLGIAGAMILHPDVANAPAPGDNTYSSCGWAGQSLGIMTSPLRWGPQAATASGGVGGCVLNKMTLKAVSPRSPIKPIPKSEFVK